MSAYATTVKYKNRKKNSTTSNTGGGGGGNNKSKGGKGKKTTNLDRFNKWLGKLFDWIEVRLDRIQRQIDLSTAKAENAIGNIADGVEKIGTISANKNKNINDAMRNISTVNGREQYEFTKSSAGTTDGVQRVTGVKYSNIGSSDTLINNNLRGANRYFAEAEKVAKKATTGKTKIINAKKANEIIAKIQSGQINIAEYTEKERAFIDAYKQWYDKAMDCVQAVEDLKSQLKELQQTKLDNITEEFETLVGYQEAITDSSKAMIEYYKSFGQNVNTGDRRELLGQRDRQNTITNDLALEFDEYTKELKNAKEVFGENSNEYHEALTTWEGIRKELIESRKATVELTHEIDELAFTVRGYAIDRLKTLSDKLSSIASLAEKRGTDTREHRVVEDYYSDQLGINYQLILKYQEEINERKAQMQKYIEDEQEGLRVDSELYQQLAGKINDAETQILSLLSANEDLLKSMRGVRWKGYEELRRQLDNIREDFQHIHDLIREGEILDNDGQLTERGFAAIALIGEDMLVAEKNISNAKAALQKLDEEYKNGIINLDTYNSEVDEQIKLIQDNAKALQDDQQALADIKIDQITAQNDALQDLIKARQDALSAKKEYYDYDKTLKQKNKDVSQLQSQINALQGVTNDAARARRAQLEAELAEKQEDLNDTLYEHSIELQQEGYDKLSEDMQEALDNAIRLINGDQKELQKTADLMLAQLQTNNINEKDIIDKIIEDRGTAIHDRQYPDESIEYSNETRKFLEETLGDNSLADQLGVGIAETVGENIEQITAAEAITGIKTDLQSYLADVNGELVGIGGKLDDIEQAINKYYDDEDSNAVLEELEKLAGHYDEMDQDKAKGVSDAISELVDANSATLADKDDIAKAKAAYDALSENQKGYISKELTDKLNADVSKVEQLQEDAKASSSSDSSDTLRSDIDPDAVLKAIQTGIQRSKTVTDKEKAIHGDLWTYLVENFGYAPTGLTYEALKNILIGPTLMSASALSNVMLKELKNLYGFKSGAKSIDEDLLAWTNEDWDKLGSEIIVRKKDNAILTPLKAGDSVIPANLASNLFKWGAISPDKFITNPFMGKWDASGGSSTNNSSEFVSAGQTIEMHFDSLFHIEGNVDESVMPRLESLGKSLVNDRDFQKNVIKFVTKDFVRESKKQGIR